jgi:hypothetical protein
MKVSAALLQKITSNQSGSDLKITGLITFDAASQLCDALANNESTDRLDLEGCGIGDKGCLLIKDLLIRNNRIKHVDLQMNQISDVGCKYLAESISQNNTLQRLYLGYNDIRDDGVLALIGSMRPRGQLEIVVSGNTQVSDEVLGRLDRALELQWTTAHMSPKQAEACFQRGLSPPPKYTFRKGNQEQDRRGRSSNTDDTDRRGRADDTARSSETAANDSDDSDEEDSEVEYQPITKKSRLESSDISSAEASPPKQPLPPVGRQTKSERPAPTQTGRKPEATGSKNRSTAGAAPLRGSPKAKESSSRGGRDGLDELPENVLPELDKTSFSEIYTGVPFTFKIVTDQVDPTNASSSSFGHMFKVDLIHLNSFESSFSLRLPPATKQNRLSRPETVVMRMPVLRRARKSGGGWKCGSLWSGPVCGSS